MRADALQALRRCGYRYRRLWNRPRRRTQRPGGKPRDVFRVPVGGVGHPGPNRGAEGEASASPLRAGRGRQKVPRRLAADDRLPWFRRNVRPLCELRRLSFRWLRWSAGMQRIDWIAVRLAALSAVSFAIGACSSDLSSTGLRKPDWASFSGVRNEFVLRPVTTEDLVGAEGQCAFAGPEQAAGAADSGTSAALVPGGVALQMTECDVVRRAGVPDKVDLGADARGDRAAVLTYTAGPLPGVYRFSAGRLVAIERAPGPPPSAAKPQKPARPAKKQAAT